MGVHKRLALVVFVIIDALLMVGASAGYAAQTETGEVVAAVAHDFYPEYRSTRTAIPAASPSTC